MFVSFPSVCEWCVCVLHLICVVCPSTRPLSGGKVTWQLEAPGSFLSSQIMFFIYCMFTAHNCVILIVHAVNMLLIYSCFLFFLIPFEDLRIEGVLHCTDYKAHWRKFVTFDTGLYKWNLTWLIMYWLYLKMFVLCCIAVYCNCNIEHEVNKVNISIVLYSVLTT